MFTARYRNTGNRSSGRIVLAGILGGYILLYFMLILSIQPGQEQELLHPTIIVVIWTAALFAAMWVCQNWARYLYLFLLACILMGTVPLIAGMQSVHMPIPIALWLLTAFHIVVFAILSTSSAVRTLTTRH